MAWGVFEKKDGKGRPWEVHVAPCGKRGALSRAHRLDATCPCICRPPETMPDGRVLYIHEAEN